jgi:hypothetical protein
MLISQLRVFFIIVSKYALHVSDLHPSDILSHLHVCLELIVFYVGYSKLLFLDVECL